MKTKMLTKNDCYIRNQQQADDRYTEFQRRGPLGIMVHSTGANNPRLSRYVGPNRYNNDWDRPGVGACVHAFIGLDEDGKVETIQTMPWNYRGWHCGRSGNNTHVAFEICEDDLKDPVYFAQVYKQAVDLCVMLCIKYNLDETDIVCHSEGHAQGIASNHADVMHWFPRFGKSMDTFREDVARQLHRAPAPAPAPDPDQLDELPEGMCQVILPLIGQDDQGESVEMLQIILHGMGYDLGSYGPSHDGIDGYAGRKTIEAVKKFQRQCHLTPDGIVGERTWSALLK